MVEQIYTNNDLDLTDYGTLALPDFSAEEAALRAVDVDIDAFFASKMLRREFLNTLSQLSGSQILREIDRLVSEFVVGQLVYARIQGDLFEHAIKGFILRKFEGVDKASSEMFVIRELNARANQLRNSLLEILLEEAPTDIRLVAVYEYHNLVNAMIATDRLAIKLFAEESPISAEERAELGYTNEWAVIRGTAEDPREVPMHKAYPEEIEAIIASYKSLLDGLDDCLREDPTDEERKLLARKVFYYQTVLAAYQSSDPDDWKLADSALADQVYDARTDVMHVHPMRTGYLSDPVLRCPQTSLRMPDNQAATAQEIAEGTRATMIASLSDPAFFGGCPIILDTVDLLRKTDVVFSHSLGSGLELDMMPKGQVSPKDFEARQQGGVSVSMNIGVERVNRPVSEAYFRAAFGEDDFFRYFSGERDFDQTMGRGMVSHKYGHLLALKPDTYDRIGDRDRLVNPYIEQWKSTAIGVIANEWIPYFKQQVGLDRLRAVMADIIFDACRYAAERHTSNGGSSFRKSMMFIRVAEEVGILSYNPEGGGFPWKIDMSQAKIEQFFGTVFDQVTRVANIYGSGTENDLRGHLGEALQSTGFSEFLCNRFPTPEPITAASMAVLPARIVPADTEELEVAVDEVRSTMEDGLPEEVK